MPNMTWIVISCENEEFCILLVIISEMVQADTDMQASAEQEHMLS